MFDDADTARGPLLALVATAALALIAGPAASPAAAHAGAYQLELTASEDCPDTTYCFEVTNGSVDEITQGEEIQVTIVNPEGNDLQHNLQVTPLANAAEDRETDSSQSEAGTDNLAPGEEASFEYFVPNGASGLYFWCSFGAHESQGMYVEVPFSEDAGTSGEETGSNGSPGLGMAAGLLAVAGAALALRRR